MHKWLRYGMIFLCLVGFVFVRFRESALFYDPLIIFFKTDYQAQPLPEMETLKYLLNIALRFMIHMMLSLAILWLVFQEVGIVRFSLILYVAIFTVLLTVLTIMINNAGAESYRSLFYVRRFLIQPILIFILIPAFYYYRKANRP
ncbi:exosortase F system-associated protein [Dokdonia sinensis]|uniref:Exosortase F system-associated protein n=1 Tax=Dokdonia sinensis TaxID=2479847 RepID=A0A3M0GGV5_9FLAO|nr:exosortase F system-associated protein [Dokdonia sinensis]RMB56556.1 exosortase F system-associated protein [Dokdonia sinensis]